MTEASTIPAARPTGWFSGPTRIAARAVVCAAPCLLFLALLNGPGLAVLEVGEPIPASFGDAIVVLGGGMRPGGRQGISTAERLDFARVLFAERQRDVVVSDGCLYEGVHAGQAMQGSLVAAGVSASRIVVEGHSQDTFENLLFSSIVSRQRGYRQVVVCTSPYHQRRVSMIARRLGLDDWRVARMPESEVRAWWRPRQALRTAQLVAREYAAIVRLGFAGR